MNYQLCLYCSVSLTFFWGMLGIFRWLRIILVCNFKWILSYFVKLLFWPFLYFVCFWFVELSSSTETFIVIGFGSFEVHFVELTFVRLSSKFQLDRLLLDRVTVFSLSVIYLNDKSAPFGELKLLLLFSFYSLLPAVPIFL